MGVPWKIQLLREGSRKNNIYRGNCLKSGLGQFADLREEVEGGEGGAWQKRGGGVFEGGLIPQCTLWWQNFFFNLLWNTLRNILFKDLLTKFCKSIFYVSAVNCYCIYIFKGPNYRFSGLLFRTCFKNSYFDTRISNYCKLYLKGLD